MGNSKAKISERTTKPNQKPRKKRWPTTSTPSLRSALGAPLPIPSSATDGTTTGWSPAGTSTTSSRSSGACKLGGGQGGREQRQDGGQDQRLRVQARGVEGLRATRKTSRGRKAAATSRGASQGATPCPRRRKLTRWFPISSLRGSLS